VRLHAAAFDTPESEGGGMPPHSKAPCQFRSVEYNDPTFWDWQMAIWCNPSLNVGTSNYNAMQTTFKIRSWPGPDLALLRAVRGQS
jgi:hypothetical protein